MEARMSTDESVKKIREQAIITAKEVMELLKDSVEGGYMTYPELVGILRHFLKQAIDEMTKYRFDLPELSVKEVGLEDLYKALENLEKRTNKNKIEIQEAP